MARYRTELRRLVAALERVEIDALARAASPAQERLIVRSREHLRSCL